MAKDAVLGYFQFAEIAFNAVLIMVAFGLVYWLVIFGVYVDDTMDDRLRTGSLKDKHVSYLQVFRMSPPEDDNVSFIEAVGKRKFFEFCVSYASFFIPPAAGLPIGIV